MPFRERAIIYVPSGPDSEMWEERCLRHVMEHRPRPYRLVALVVDTDGRKFADVLQMTNTGRADVVVVADLDHLPPDRRPRIEVASQAPWRAPVVRRRARIIRRPNAS